MSVILLTSILLRAAALGWSIVALLRRRDWRMLFLAGMLALMTTRQVWTLATTASDGLRITDQLSELPGLAVSIMALLAVVFLEQALTGIEQTTTPSSTRRMALTAVLVGGLTIVACGFVGYLAWDMSLDELEEMVAHQNLAMARTLGSQALDRVPSSSRRIAADARDEIERMWRRTAPPIEGSYLCVIEPPGVVALHTANPRLHGRLVGDMALRFEAPDDVPDRVRDLLLSRQDWAGIHLDLTGLDQAVGYAFFDRAGFLVGVHTPGSILRQEFRSAATPWAVGLALIGGVLVPLSVGLLHRSYSQARAGVQGVERRRQELEEQLRQSQKMEAIGRLAGGVAHDFNNLLTAIMGNAEQARDRLRSYPDAQPLDENLVEIERASERAATLTRQLLAFSRKQPVELEVLDLNRAVLGMEPMLRRLIGEDVALKLRLLEGAPPVRGDAGLIEQILLNLVINARDAMPDGGTLVVETRRHEWDGASADSGHAETDGVALVVSDTGIGMSEEVAERIFEPFFTTKSRDRGTGLGLSTVYGIVQKLDGTIQVASHPRGGTVFTVAFPALDPATLPATADKAITETRPPAGRILVCEDDEAVRVLICTMLKQEGYDVVAAPDAEHALELAQEIGESLDLLLTDIVLPDTDGCALARMLHDSYPELKTLFVSGYAGDVIGERTGAGDTTELLQKPFSSRALLTKVADILGGPRRV